MNDFSNFIKTFDNIANLNKKSIPERITHAKGYGAYGTFTVTHNVSNYTLANFLQKENVTRVFLRFSNYKGERGFPDTFRDPKGIAIKFFTKDGIFDLTGNNIPVFFIREPSLFPEFLLSQKRNPQTNFFDPEIFWSFFAKYPQTLHSLLFYFSERGIPKSFRHAHYYSCNALKFYISQKEYFVKFHIKTLQGIENLSSSEGEEIAKKEPDFYGKDLYYSIQTKNFPKWKIYFQAITPEEIQKFAFDPFDATKVWSQKEFPLQELGILELNENPKDYFEEVEKSTFSPNNLVKGIELSPDPILQMRALVYSDAQRDRVGLNNLQYKDIFIKQEFSKNNIFSLLNGQASKWNKNSLDALDDYFQPRIFFQSLSSKQKQTMSLEISKTLRAVTQITQEKVFELFSKIDSAFSKDIQAQTSTYSTYLLHD